MKTINTNISKRCKRNQPKRWHGVPYAGIVCTRTRTRTSRNGATNLCGGRLPGINDNGTENLKTTRFCQGHVGYPHWGNMISFAFSN